MHQPSTSTSPAASTSTLIVRGAALPFGCFHLGSDVYMNTFLDSVSLRKYKAFGSRTLYPSRVGRLFSMDAWKQLLPVGHRISACLMRGETFAPVMLDNNIEVRVLSHGDPAKRGVYFMQEQREQFALGPEQWRNVMLHGRQIIATSSHPPSMPLSLSALTAKPTTKRSRPSRASAGGKGSGSKRSRKSANSCIDNVQFIDQLAASVQTPSPPPPSSSVADAEAAGTGEEEEDVELFPPESQALIEDEGEEIWETQP